MMYYRSYLVVPYVIQPNKSVAFPLSVVVIFTSPSPVQSARIVIVHDVGLDIFVSKERVILNLRSLEFVFYTNAPSELLTGSGRKRRYDARPAVS